jgi:hypothetical protein
MLRYDYYEDKFVPILAKEWKKAEDQGFHPNAI